MRKSTAGTVLLLLLRLCLLVWPCGGASKLLRSAKAPPIFQPLGETTYGHAGPAMRTKYIDQQAPGWKCLACEDVAETWRQTFRCAGNLDTESSTVSQDIWDYRGCHSLGMCSSLAVFGTSQVVNCEQVRKAMTVGSKTRYYYEKAGLIMGLSHFGNTGTLMSIPPDPKSDGPEKNAEQVMEEKFKACSEFCSSDALDCLSALSTPECRSDLRCETLVKSKDICAPSCISCVWAIEGLPRFAELCKLGIFETETKFGNGNEPMKLGDPNSGRNTLKVGSDVLPEASGSKSGSEARFKPKEGLGSAPLETDGPLFALPRVMGWDGEEKPPISFVKIKEVCYDMWDELGRDTTARYMVQYVDNLGPVGEWNAHTVCQCLHKCPYNEFQALDLLPACSAATNIQSAESVLKESLFPDNPYGWKTNRIYGTPPGGNLPKESKMVQTFNQGYKGFKPEDNDIPVPSNYAGGESREDPFKVGEEKMDELDRT